MQSQQHKTALITGGTDGIGQQVALQLAQQDYNLILVGRSSAKAAATIDLIQHTSPDASITFWQYDLSLMRDVQSLSDRLHSEYHQLNVIVLCAGVMLKELTLTDEGLETVFAVQYLGRYWLLNQIIDLLQATDDARVVNVSAGGNVTIELDFNNLNGQKNYDGVQALRQESVANDMLTIDFNERYPDLNIYCYGPGYVKTTLMRDMPLWLQKVSAFIGLFIGYTPEQAADDILTLLNGDYAAGLYDRQAKQNPVNGFRGSAVQRERLRKVSDEMIASTGVMPPALKPAH